MAFQVFAWIGTGTKDTAAWSIGLKGTAEHPIIGQGLVVDATCCIASCPVKIDGEFHEYTLDLSANHDWKGMVDELWFEACQIMHARVAIDWMRFE